MISLSRFIDRLRRPDEDLAQQLRAAFACVLLGYGIAAIVLFLVYVLAEFAPHPLSLFLGDLHYLIPFAFRILSFLCGSLLFLLLVLRLIVVKRLRS